METAVYILTGVLIGILGLCVGSFLNVVIYRVPNGTSIAWPPSHCTTCNSPIKWYDNIPVLSYIILGGKCRKCRERISPMYPCVEAANCVLWVACFLLFWKQGIAHSLISMAVCSVLICIFMIDFFHHLIFYRFQIAVAVLAVADIFAWKGVGIWDRLIGAAGGALVLGAVYAVFLLILKREGMGIGDIILVTSSGLLLGWKGLLLGMVIGSVTASVILLVSRAKKGGDRFSEYPFAPFIVLGDILALFFGDMILKAYLGLF